jgi:hypothetical protein
MAHDPDRPDGIDTEGKAVPPYEGRRESADVTDPSYRGPTGGEPASSREGARVGGATGPVVDDEPKAPDPADTPGGATGSPSDEQPASLAPQTDRDDDRVGPTHHEGTGRAEDQP